MKTFQLSLCLAMLSLGAVAQNNNYPTTGSPTIYDYSPSIFLQRNNSEGGYTQGIQTKLFDGTNNWFFGNLHDGQWMVAKGDYNNPKLVVSSNGNVGVGTISPASKFHILADANTSGAPANAQLFITGATSSEKRLSLAYNTSSNYGELQAQAYNGSYVPIALNPNGGSVGIGTASPVSKLDVNGGINMTDGQNLTWGGSYGPGIPTIASSASAGINFYPTGSTSGSAMKVDLNGNVLINKLTQTNTAYKLDINGKVRANEIVVNTTGADFVFEDGYKLHSLAEIEQFIKQNKHLPEIADAKTMQREGVGVSELQTKLLQKIEELTLHLIEKDKELQNSNKRLENLEAKQKQLEAMIQKIAQKN